MSYTHQLGFGFETPLTVGLGSGFKVDVLHITKAGEIDEPSLFTSEDYSPMRDMTCQPSHCGCGAAFRRHGAYLFCTSGHERGIECVGREDHPRNAEWEAYLDANGRDAFQRAIERHHQQRPWR